MLRMVKSVSRYKKQLWFVMIAVMILTLMGFGCGTYLEKLEMWNIAGIYNFFVSLPCIGKCTYKLRFFLLSLNVILAVIIAYKPCLILIRHTSYSPALANVDPQFGVGYYSKICKLNLCTEMENIQGVQQAIIVQQQVIKKLQNCRVKPEVVYYGIAHTPLVFHLGFMFGDQSNVRFLHKARDNRSNFVEWSKKFEQQAIVLDYFEDVGSSKDLIVSVSTSQKIGEQDFASLKPDDKHILMFYTNNMGFDVITSYQTAESLRNSIMIKLREVIKKHRIEKIHLVISSSVSFTFFLAQAFSVQHDPVVVIYHYQNGEFPWGICVNNPPASALVVNDSIKRSTYKV